MPRIINLTSHSVQVYDQSQFVNLEQVNPTTWVADGVEGDPIAEFPSSGIARIEKSTQLLESELPGEIVSTVYGQAIGIPTDLNGTEVLIVSLAMQSMAKAASLPEAYQMVVPYKVVRLRSNGSLILGCMGFTY